MTQIKVGDLLDIRSDSTDYSNITRKEGKFPREVTYASDTYVRFNGNSFGWRHHHFIKVDKVGPNELDKAYNKYNREIVGLEGVIVHVDVYRVLDAFKVTDPALQHLIKKALCVGIRGHKDATTDYTDILKSAEKALLLHTQKEAK